MAALKFPEGTTYRHTFTLQNADGTPIDLTGLVTTALTFAVYTPDKPKTGTPVALLTKTIGSGIVLVTPASGICRVDFLPADTIDKAAQYEWELELTELSGDVFLMGTGTLIVTPARRLDA